MASSSSTSSRPGAAAKPAPIDGLRLASAISGLLPYLIGFASLFLAWHVFAVYVLKSALFPPPLAVQAVREGHAGPALCAHDGRQRLHRPP